MNKRLLIDIEFIPISQNLLEIVLQRQFTICMKIQPIENFEAIYNEFVYIAIWIINFILDRFAVLWNRWEKSDWFNDFRSSTRLLVQLTLMSLIRPYISPIRQDLFKFTCTNFLIEILVQEWEKSPVNYRATFSMKQTIYRNAI